MSYNPNDFIYTSDFPTFINTNDDNPIEDNITITEPATLADSASYTVTKDISIPDYVGLADSLMWLDLSTLPLIPVACKQYSQGQNGTESGFPAPYSVFAFWYKINSTTIRLQASMTNPYSGTLTTSGSTLTFGFRITTFLVPYA